jgi:CheY-like chemotaxis protein
MGGTIRVLHVDDDGQFTHLTASFLDRFGEFAVTSRTSYEGAVNAVDGEAFDCVVCDYDLGEHDGLDVLKTVRDVNADVPFVLFTAKGSERVASEAIAAGATDYLQKGGGDSLASRERAAKAAVIDASTPTRGAFALEDGQRGVGLVRRVEGAVSTGDKWLGDIDAVAIDHARLAVEHRMTIAADNLGGSARCIQTAGDLRAKCHDTPIGVPLVQDGVSACGVAPVVPNLAAEQAGTYQHIYGRIVVAQSLLPSGQVYSLIVTNVASMPIPACSLPPRQRCGGAEGARCTDRPQS